MVQSVQFGLSTVDLLTSINSYFIDCLSLFPIVKLWFDVLLFHQLYESILIHAKISKHALSSSSKRFHNYQDKQTHKLTKNTITDDFSKSYTQVKGWWG